MVWQGMLGTAPPARRFVPEELLLFPMEISHGSRLCLDISLGGWYMALLGAASVRVGGRGETSDVPWVKWAGN
jgi:hypothetical protein